MKKFYILVGLALALFSGALAQSLSIVSADENPYGSSEDFIIQSNAVVKNIGSTTIDVKAKRIEEQLVSGTINYFCWTLCYGPMTDESPDALTFAPGQERSDFVADYEPDHNEGVSTITYVFFDEQNPNDSVAYTVNYLVTPVGINENVWAVNDPYPNPANTTVTFDYKAGAFGDALVSIYDMLGNVRKEAKMQQGMSRMVMDVADLEPGVYFYSIKIDNHTSITKKMIVSRS
jgi:hypothetical protein